VSFVSPLATALAGKEVGDEVEVLGGKAEIVALE
jgi:transcription elongation GreA/GreB family factor